ncbi:hypothetical protein FQN49_000937 [Arthroderma sp. PD_2]|nr:hypothetical protein FQN49_000937 [Arthroderma sp. PD_2]
MSSDDTYTAELSLRGTPTKTVTLAPERATVAREITDVPIKAGPNKITIIGFDNSIDFDSLRVTGHGPATITDIQTVVDYRDETFEDVYPSDDDDSDDEAIESEDPDDDFGVDKSELDEVTAEIKDLDTKLAFLENDKLSSTQSLGFLDAYGQSMVAKNVDVAKVAEYIHVYQKERTALRETFEKSQTGIADLNEKRAKLERKQRRLQDKFNEARDKAAKPSRKEREAKRKAKLQKRNKKEEPRKELRKFWCPFVGRVILHLDGLGDGTTTAGRRDSVISAKKPALDGTITLSLTYVTANARWTPRYDLMLHTPTSSGKLIYRAEYYNKSFETWEDTTVILSTSQTTFSGVDEHIPSLLPWNVKLRKYEAEMHVATDGLGAKRMSHWNGALKANAEGSGDMRVRQNRARNVANQPTTIRYMQVSNSSSLPPPPPPLPTYTPFGASSALYLSELQQARGASEPQQALQNFQQGSNSTRLFGAPASASASASAFGGAGGDVRYSSGPQQAMAPPVQQYAQMAQMAPSQPGGFGGPPGGGESSDESDDDLGEGLDDDASTIHGSSNVLSFRQSSRHDYGLTTTYNVPGLRTLQPSSHVRRHIIAEIDLSSVTFSHVIVPKLKQAAFLKGRVMNTSTTPLLRGKAGLTVDDAFLGKAIIPNCNPGVPFSLNLGVDPAIQVTYSKPKIRRATTGYFNKEDCAIFTRICRINNTKTSPVSLVVFDQVPVSEDERVRVRLIEPKGLDKEGDSARIGADICIDPKRAKDWGKGNVSLNRDGEIKWVISLAKAVDIRLVLEYEAKIPSGLEVVGF